jgi:hypothetical protein
VSSSGWIKVRWDAGTENSYRFGAEVSAHDRLQLTFPHILDI